MTVAPYQERDSTSANVAISKQARSGIEQNPARAETAAARLTWRNALASE